MLLKMIAGLSGPDLSLSPGDEHEFDEAEAKRLKEAGFAVDAEPKDQAKAKRGKVDVVSVSGDNSGG